MHGLGYGNEELVETAREQMSRLSFTHLFGGHSHEPAIALAEKIKAISPVPASKVFFTNSGSEANDTQVKLAWYYNNARGRPKQQEDHLAPSRLSRHHRCHRQPDRGSPCSIAISTCRSRACCTPTARTIASTRKPARARRPSPRAWPADLEDMIEREGPDTIAAFIAEPVMGAGGVLIPPRHLLREGAGRAAQARHPLHRRRGDLRLRPHRQLVRHRRPSASSRRSVTMAKAVTSAYVPIGALTVTEHDL